MALTHSDVGQILTLTNRRLAEDIGEDRFVSLFLGRIDPRSRTLLYSSAGHPTGFVLDKRGELKTLLKSTGTLLGLNVDSQFPVARPVALESGDMILLFTDGVIEAQSPDEQIFGVGKALALVRECRRESADVIVEALLSAVHDFTGPRQQDDMTVLVAKAA
jgi:serine phosphatase RsbU (regulator of sigma subunit)